ncbi:MAG TPA: bifunctional riboflavin kinase/FAD synthetase [Thermomicrobiales bacterium]
MTTAPVLYTELEQVPSRLRVVSIGTFDGVHRGHQSLLERTVTQARELGLPALVLTFDPVPAAVLRPDKFPGRICSAEEKLEQLGRSGVDEIVSLEFTIPFSRQTPEEFMARVARIGLVELWVGEAFALGKDRAGDVNRLREIGEELGFKVTAVPRLTNGEQVISSSAIRAAIMEGDVARARRLLGRPFRVHGEVIHGAHLGRAIGYPTANFLPPNDLVPLADGIYASYAYLPGAPDARPSMTYVGTRPTVDSGARQVETHIFDFDGDLYGQMLHVEVIERLRGDQKFASLDELIEQLGKDEQAARSVLQADAQAAP